MESPSRLIKIAFGLLIVGAVLPFLMVIGLLESTLFLNFVAVASSIAGLTVGFLGITQYFRSRR
jgi:hypothetical protein